MARLARDLDPQVLCAERARLLGPLLDDVDTLAAESNAAMRTTLAAYAAQGEAFLKDVRAQTRRNYVVMLESLIEGRALTDEDLAFQRGGSMRRARAGIALEDYLGAYRVGQGIFWDAIVASAGDDAADRDLVLTLAADVMRMIDLSTSNAAKAYVEFRQYAMLDVARERRDLLEHLLDGHFPRAGALAAAAARFRLEEATPAVVAVAVELQPQADGESGEMVGSRLSHAILPGTPSLVVPRRSEIVAVLPLPGEGDLAAVCQRLEELQEELRPDGAPLAIGISTVARDVTGLPAASREAVAAQRFVDGGGGVVALAAMSALDYLALTADDTARRLISPRVRAFVAEDRQRGGVLIATLRALVEADLSLKNTSERLHTHVNTVQYRLQRVSDVTGLNPRRLPELQQLLIAIALDDAAEVGG